jgi:alcohol dehydrogenase, propanol-preferring
MCADCKNDDEGYVYCQREQQTLGLTRDGGFSEYMITDSLSAFHIPKEISFVDAAPLMCAGVFPILNDQANSGHDLQSSQTM